MVDGNAFALHCAENGVRITSISTGMGFAAEGLSLTDDDAGVRRRARVRLEGMMELAAKLGSSIIIGLLRGKIPDFSRYSIYEDRLTENLLTLLDKAGELDVNLDLEPICHLKCNFINTAHEALDYVTRIDHPRLRVLLDTYHMNMEDRDIPRCVGRLRPASGVCPLRRQ